MHSQLPLYRKIMESAPHLAILIYTGRGLVPSSAACHSMQRLICYFCFAHFVVLASARLGALHC